MVDFVKRLPLDSEVDFSILDKEIAANPSDEITFEEVFNMSPPAWLVTKSAIKGKVMIVERKPFNNKSGETIFFGRDRLLYR